MNSARRTLKLVLIPTFSIFALVTGGCSSGSGTAGTGGSVQTGGTGGGGVGGLAGAASATGGQAGTSPDAGATGGIPANVAVTAVGSQSAAPNTAMIGPAGGTVTSPDQKLVVSIPAGALSANTTIGIGNITNTAPGGIGSAYRLTPNGLTFAVPVTFIYTPGTDLNVDPPLFVGLAFQTPAHTWQVVDGTTTAGPPSTLTTTTTHFTDYAYYSLVQLTGPSAMFVGQSDTFQVEVAVLTQDGQGLSSLANSAEPYLNVNPPPSWAVNGMSSGVINSDAPYGYVATLNGSSATYTAPAHLPSSGNPVAVSATLLFGSDSLTVVKNVHLLAHQYHVDLTYEHQDVCAGMAQGGGPAFDLTTATSFDITLDADFNVTGSNFAAEVDPPTVAGLTWCPFIPPVPETITLDFLPDQSHGIVVSAVSGSFDQNTGKLHVIPNAGMISDFPAYEEIVSINGTTVSDTTIAEDRAPVDFTGLFFDGKDGDMAPVYAPVAGSFSTVTIGATLHVLQE
jgi:hypothetical protein